MTQRGELFGEGPQACPFIALELDRDRRSDKPDYRHRCFAEPTPQPRAIAHQERYCLSADFAACPIFQGWAMRAAARPVPVPAGYEGRAKSAPPLVDQPPRASAQPALPPDVPLVVPLPGEAWPTDAFAAPVGPDAPSQMPAFGTAADNAPVMPAAPAMPDASSAPSTESQEGEPEPSSWSSSSAPLANASDEPPVPGFLAGRAERPVSQRPRASRPEVPFRETVTREDVVPSWDLTDRYGADVAEHRGREGSGGDDGGDRFGGMITAVVVIAILALGVLGVIFLPGLLAGKGPAATATPTFSALPTSLLSPSLSPSVTGTPLITAVPTAEVTPTPEVTPRLYRIKASDNSLTQIAHRFGLTLRQLLDANPQITDPNHIEVGQVITIPEPPPATPQPTA